MCRKNMKDLNIAITAASYSGNKGAAAMLQSSIAQLKEVYGDRLNIQLMSVYPSEDRLQCPHDFVNIVPAQPQRLLFLAFPCAVLYRIFGWCPPIRAALLQNQILKTYAEADMVLDEAGIAFSDSRGFILNTYAFVCAAVPMLMGAPLVKYSQAMGPFHNSCNRFLAKWILPKAELLIARGRFTMGHLHAIGIRQNVRLCADGAFTMPEDEKVNRRVQKACMQAGVSHMAGLSISSVVERRCRKLGIDYCGIMVNFICYLNQRGYQVYMFANAARIHSKKPRNNDLMIGDAIARAYRQTSYAMQQRNNGGRLLWEHREMDAEEIRAYIGQCELVVASRFHAMVFALSQQVPVMLIGWSHKYQEVMEQFGLGEYSADYTTLSEEQLRQSFEDLVIHQEEIREKIAQRLPKVKESSAKNIKYAVQILERILEQKQKDKYYTSKIMKARLKKRKHVINHVIDLDHSDFYIASHISCGMGYAADDSIRANAASGGMVTALLCSLLKNRDIDGAWVVKTAFTEEGKLTYDTYIATTLEQIREASSSVYMHIPMMAHLKQLREFDGRLAVVLTPCMMYAFSRILEQDEMLRSRIILKFGLFCSGAHDAAASEMALDKCRISREGADRLYYRRGHWRGTSSVLYKNGTCQDFSYTKSICAYKNAYFFVQKRCLSCKDQFAAAADISFGDVWLPEMKKAPVKYTGYIVRSQKALELLRRAVRQGDLVVRYMSDAQMLRSQMRALTFKYRGNCWNHRLAGSLAEKNREFSMNHPDWLKRIPMPAIYYYMCLIRVLLSW